MLSIQRLLLISVFSSLLWTSHWMLQRIIPVERTEIQAGISYEHRRLEQPFVTSAHIVRIDLNTPGLEFRVTPPEADGGFIARRTSVFAREFSTLVAINGGTFFPHHDTHLLDYYPGDGNAITPTALSVTNGTQYSAPRDRWPSLCIQTENKVSIAEDRCPADTIAALSGVRIPVKDGKLVNRRPNREQLYSREPRTAVGLSQFKNRLFLVVVDGRQPVFNEGMSEVSLANFLRNELGIFDALELDGGGSSTMVIRDRTEYRLTNTPVHNGIPGRERPVANHLGIVVSE